MKMKKCIALLLAAAMALPLMACGDSSDLYEVDMKALEELEELPEGVDPEAFEAYKQAQEAGTESSKSAKTGSTGKKSADEADISEKAYLALGNDLKEDQLKTVLGLMRLSEEEYEECDIVYVTNEEEHAFLDNYLDSSLIGTRALSSVLVRPAEEGSGIEVTTENISFCTPDMYRNAFQTAGVEDADIIVAGPFEISGTAALIGAVKAYEKISGITISDTIVDAAIDELITTGEIADAVGSREEAAKLMAYIKAKALSEKPTSREELEALVRQTLKDLGIELPDEYINRIVDFLLKLLMAGIDLNQIPDEILEFYQR
ncbi:MAG: DUF1002 domain-containing protein [Lachnospiraceae bacterium]|nr:DUF1002 domain-containing protein [Lachnospiraceae bacterium]